jgi:hypothetical protein
MQGGYIKPTLLIRTIARLSDILPVVLCSFVSADALAAYGNLYANGAYYASDTPFAVIGTRVSDTVLQLKAWTFSHKLH